LLQGLLETYPRLIGGAAPGSGDLLLVKREIGIPGALEAADRWSLDHLFLDADAVPVLVEVKRSTDTRIRREVVGQMLDYAANAVVYWPVERLQADFHETTLARGEDPSRVMEDFLGVGRNADEFWWQAKLNLQAGRVRMLFVADVIPPELKRIIEFLNDQLDPAEMLGIEVRRYAGAGVQSLVPCVVGQTAEAERRKGRASSPRQWDRDAFMRALAGRPAPDPQTALRLLDWAMERDLRIWWGRGAKDGSFYPLLDLEGTTQYTFAVWTGTESAYLQFQFPQMVAPFDGPASRSELLRRLGDAAQIHLDTDAKFPSVRLADLDEARLAGLLAVFEWVLEETLGDSSRS
jgi:hypothetical protein